MTQQTMMRQARIARADEYRSAALPAYTIRVVGALLALAITAVHIADQGGATALASPDWLGWSYRLIEAGGIATAVALLVPPRPALPGWLAWAAAAPLAAGPFLGYLASRTVGVPQDPADVGNWGHWIGTVSLFIEAALFALAAGMLLSYRRRAA
jgi:hypothetical protein